MKKRFLLAGSVLLLGVTAGALALVGCGEGKTPEEKVPVVTERIRYSEKTNPYAELTWQEFKDVEDWNKKQESDSIYYQFEGSYSEAYQNDYSRTFLYMNCYEDGGLHAIYGSENYYGYWTNVDKRGNESLVLHIVRYNDQEYNDGIYESVCEVKSHDYYEYASTVIWNRWGTRTIIINGYHYSPVKSLTVSGGQTACIVGDSFSTSGLSVLVTRENGKSIAIDEQSFPQKDCRVKFDGFDSSEKGEKEITVSYVYSDVKTSYKCNVYGLNSITVNVGDGKTTYHVGDTLDTKGIIVTAAREDGENPVLASERLEFSALDGNTVGEQEITITLKGTEFKTSYKVNVVGVKNFEVDAENAQTEFYVGDRLNTENLVIKATFEDDVTEEIAADRCAFEGFDSASAIASQEVTVKFYEHSDTYHVQIIAPVFTGTGKYNGTEGEVSIKVVTPDVCELTYNGNTVELNYTTMNAAGMSVYSLSKPEGSTISDTEWEGFHKQYVLNRDGFTLSMATVYKIPDQGADRPANEPMPGIGGNTELRYIILDEEKGEATITYKYWYAAHTDTFICKYTLEDGILTFTELVQVVQVGGNNSQYGNLHKTWRLHDDYSATKYTPAE